MPAFVFAGQGAQRQGMGRPWTTHPSWELVADASDATGRDLAHLLLDAGAEELTETRSAQLATVTHSLVILDAVERLGIAPTVVAGHSVGEYTALIAAGALGFEDGLRLVAERGEAMQAAADAEPGVMVLVRGTDPDTVDVACRLAEGDVWVANVNSTRETVVAGEAEAVARAGAWARRLGATALTPVATGGAFHTPLMATARPRLRKALADVTFHDPEVAVVANVDGRAHVDADPWPLLLSAQLCSPVRWHQTVTLLGGISDPQRPAEDLFVELGPGASLVSMIRRSVPAATALSVRTPDDLDRLVDAVVGRLQVPTPRHRGEHLHVSERMVISPGPGIFTPAEPFAGAAPPPGAGAAMVEVGTLLGDVSGLEVRSAFAGTLMGMLAQTGERVQPGQPVAWLRAAP